MQDKPLPNINGDSREFWIGCAKHELRFQKCEDCGHVRWPASIICPRCHSRNASWIVSGGKGKIYTFVVYRVAYHPTFAKDIPYIVAVVELNEGPHLLTNIVACPIEEMKCEMSVEVIWKNIKEDVCLPLFKPV